MPVYNASACLDEAITSCLLQTEENFELICIDDGSLDDSATIIRNYTLSDKRVQLLNIPHQGIVAALNFGLSIGKGKYIARMDADDRMHRDRLLLQRNFLDTNASVGLVSCIVNHIGDANYQAGYAYYVDWINSLISHRDISLNRFVESPLAHPSVMFRRDLIEKYGGYRDGVFPEDYELWLRWLEAGVRMEKITLPLLDWRDLPTRLSRNDQRYSSNGFEKIKAEYMFRFIKEANKTNRPVFVCGAGRITRKKSVHLRNAGLKIAAFIDVDPKKSGKKYDGIPVIPTEEIPQSQNAFVISFVGNRGARNEIRNWLTENGYKEGDDFILAG
jgi:glycosyltransferase involved in cell wall biosynthesis